MAASSTRLTRTSWARALLLSAVLGGSLAQARPAKRRSVVSLDPDWASAPSVRYAGLTSAECLAELSARRIAYQPVREAPGVVTPVRVLDGVGGVLYRTALSRQQRATNPHDVFDCRLVVALDDFSKILRAHGVDEVLMFSGWRPPRKGWPHDKPAPRHPGGMAIDLYRLGTWQQPATAHAPGTGSTVQGDAAAGHPAPRHRVWLDVHQHFGGQIGSTTCGPQARPPRPATDEAKQLRQIVCETATARIFTSILTPNHDRAHFNHMHLDLTPGVKWRIVR